MKRFGATKRNAPPAKREDFEFAVQRDGEDELHTFTAVVNLDFVGLVQMLWNSKNDPSMAGQGMLVTIAKMLDNTDGTPNKWEPEVVKPPKRERAPQVVQVELGPGGSTSHWPGEVGTLAVDSDEDDVEEELPPVFRAPCGPEKGELLPFERAEEFLRHEAGSSRRRWREVLLDDDEVSVKQEAITELFEWLMGLAAERPTR